ncbi:MAG: hypothetical protein ACHQ9S_26270 [Candidatus Binatia bacterium]
MATKTDVIPKDSDSDKTLDAVLTNVEFRNSNGRTLASHQIDQNNVTLVFNVPD